MGPRLTWDQVAIGIPTMPERRDLLEELTARLRGECIGATVVIHAHEPGTSPRRDLPELMAAVLAADRDWTLLLEDDVWPAPAFGQRALRALRSGVALAGADAVSLFSRSAKDLDMLDRGECIRRQAPSAFCMMQGVFVRSELLRGLPDWAQEWYGDHPEHVHAADLLLGSWLSRVRARLAVHVPSLVQHRAVPSTLPGGRGVRQSESYRRVFGAVPGEVR